MAVPPPHAFKDIVTLRDAISHTIAASKKDLELGKKDLAEIAEVLVDDALLFRFLKKHQYNLPTAQQALLKHIDWRLQNDLSSLHIQSLSPAAQSFIQKGLFRFHRFDKFGRPVAVVNLRQFSFKDGSDVDDLRWCLVVMMEVGRRLIMGLNDEIRRRNLENHGHHHHGTNAGLSVDNMIHQIAVIVDLEGVGLSNMNYEMIPLFHDLFSKHYPQTIGTVYVLNYGWIHAGIWSLIKRVLSAEACKRCMFISKDQLRDYVEVENLLVEHGGIERLPPPHLDPILLKYAGADYTYTSKRVHDLLTILDAEDEGYHEEETSSTSSTANTPTTPTTPSAISITTTNLTVPADANTPSESMPTTPCIERDVWFDAVESPAHFHHTQHELHNQGQVVMSPVRSAADLQSLLRVNSSSRLGGRNSRSGTSLKSLAMTSLNGPHPASSASSAKFSSSSGTSISQQRGEWDLQKQQRRGARLGGILGPVMAALGSLVSSSSSSSPSPKRQQHRTPILHISEDSDSDDDDEGPTLRISHSRHPRRNHRSLLGGKLDTSSSPSSFAQRNTSVARTTRLAMYYMSIHRKRVLAAVIAAVVAMWFVRGRKTRALVVTTEPY
ncbi:hypothetical protein HK104_010393 [Borealophlyctis nickersoniae]|nr:hypothetical protein HK104_010393 [Borealophlyctis nickersoniae]